ncbi:MAG: hypothetical protein H6719_11410 [Sandaracinaceae bacterium]|nr:hypothetical protein [Sandaracinaceae bacterium]
MRPCFALLALSLVACDGGSGDSCVLDSDCPSFLDVCIDGTCQPAGTVPESGTPPEMDAGGGRDSGTRMDASEPDDAGEPMDAEPTDAGEPTDAEPMDAMPTDAPEPVCDMPGPTWTVAFVSAPASCGDATTGRAVAIAPIAGMPCQFSATSPAEPALSGSFGLDPAGMVLGMLATGTSAPVTCSGTYNAAAPSFTIICGSCVMNLNPL